MSMDEDAMFKALLKNKPQKQKTPQTQAADEVKPTAPVQRPSPAKNSEDAMFQVLLKNKPEQQPLQKGPEMARPQIPAQSIAPEKEEPVVEARISPVVSPAINQAENAPSKESLDKLAESVNKVYGLLKTVTIVLVLILVVGIAVLVKV
jgi:hypothetical protein